MKLALGDNWKELGERSGGAPGTEQAQQEGETAEEAAGQQEAETAEQEDAMAAAFAAPDPQVDEAGPFSPRPLAARGASSSGAKDSGAGTAEAAKGANLLALKLETILALYGDTSGGKWWGLQQAYTVDWEAELGHGSYGKVYLGRKGILGRDECKGAFAIKMLRDEKADVSKGHNAQAELAAELEVARHVTLGLHPNVVGLVDVGLFNELQSPGAPPPARRLARKQARKARPPPLQQSAWPPPQQKWASAVQIGLVFDLYEIDVRQFLMKSSFAQSCMRHVLNSVLEGLQFIHDKGCIHTDLKPANVFMRGAIHWRGCFGREVLTRQELGEWDPAAPSPHSRTEFEYQIPKSFEARGPSARMLRFELSWGSSTIEL